MIRLPRLAAPALALATLIPFPAFAQAPSGLPPGGTVGGEETKPEGVAEKAPEQPGQLPTTPVLPPWPSERRKRLQLFEFDGYLRLRTDWFSALNLGFSNPDDGVPFGQPLSCQLAQGSCDDTIGTANMRLRLEPSIYVSEDVVVKTQLDILDNLVLGATPDGLSLMEDHSGQLVFVTDGQAPPDATRNFAYDSIRAKRAWAEVMTPLGLLKFGRQPNHWALGISANAGGTDPFLGRDCDDCDFGDSVDRVSFSTYIPGTKFTAALGLDWLSSEPVSAQSALWANRYLGQPMDLDDADDVTNWILTVGRLDSPAEFDEKVAEGELALNYGVYMQYRKQDYETLGFELDEAPDEAAAITINRRSATAYIPDLYFRLGWGDLSLLAEAVLVYGTIDSLEGSTPVAATGEQTMLSFGGVLRLNYLLLDRKLNVGVETGYASGDQYDTVPQGSMSYHDIPIIPTVPGDKDMTLFLFDPDYHVDLILFREVIGTVTNAIYVKPTLSYELTERILFRAQVVTSFAPIQVATPGNDWFYGIELDGDLGYGNTKEGFFGGISYGVLFPMGALDRSNPSMGWETTGDAATAQTLQTRVMVKF